MAEIFYCAKKSITLLIYLEVLRANFAKLSFLGSMADPSRLQNDRLYGMARLHSENTINRRRFGAESDPNYSIV